MDISRIYENLRQLKSTDLAPASDEEIKAQIVSATQLVGDDLAHYVIPRGFKGISHNTSGDHIPTIYAVAGIGIMAFIDKIRPHHLDDVIFYEPVPGLAYLFLSQVSLQQFFGNSNIHIFTNLDDLSKKLKNVYEWWKTIEAFKSPPSAKIYPDKTKAFYDRLIENGLVGRVNQNTLNKLYFKWLKNEITNIHALKDRKVSISRPAGMKDVPAILVGAGPSLHYSLDALKKAYQSNSVLIIAASTTLRVLIPAEIYPHFVIIIEGEKQTHFEGIKGIDRLRLLAHLQTSPEHLIYPFKDIYWFNQETSALAPMVSSMLPEIRPIKFSGNVLSAAFLIASFWGCNPIVFTGMDMAYKSGDKYLKGLEKQNDKKSSDHLYDVQGQDGASLKAPPEFLSYVQNLEDEIERLRSANPQFVAINASSGGRRIRGTIEMTLKDFLTSQSGKDVSVDHLISQYIASWPTLPAARIKTFFQSHHNTYQRLAKLLENPAELVKISEPLKRINKLLYKLPEFNTSVIRLIPWVRHILSKQDVTESDLVSLKAVIRQILDRSEVSCGLS